MKYTNSYKVTIDFLPWFEEGYYFTRLHMYEELGGKISGGTIELEHNGSEKALKLITDQYTGQLSIEQDGGNIYDISVFITNKRFYNNFVTLEFVCISDKKFFTDTISTEWTDIGGAIESLYPGPKDIRCESDINNGVKIFQNSESNYSLCTKLAYSFKHSTIFAYGFSGLLLKEIVGIDSGGNKEPYYEINSKVEIHQIDSYTSTYNKRLYYLPLNPWEENEVQDYTELQGKNLRTGMFYNDYQIVGKDYEQMMNNYWFNKRYMESDLYTAMRVVDLNIPVYRLGDVLKYKADEKDLKLPFDLYLVRSNELFFAKEGSSVVDANGLSFSWTSKFIGIQQDGSILPESDPTNN